MFLADVEALSSAAGRVLLTQIGQYHPGQAMKLAEHLVSDGVDPSLVAAALTQARLRDQAAIKFGEFAEGLMFTDQGLQQATRLNVAGHRADRFRKAGLNHIVDLTCGIGADSMALAVLDRQVTAYEIDPVTAAVARANLARFPGTRVINQDSTDIDLSQFDAAIADPSRRSATGKRTFSPSAYMPPLETLFDMRHKLPIAIKAAPGLPHNHIPDEAEAQWVSVDGAVVETGLYFGPLRQLDQPGRTALVIRHRKAYTLRQRSSGLYARSARSPIGALPTGPLANYLYEPDGAVIRASLLAEAAGAAGLNDATLISPKIAYLTASEPTSSPYFVGYQVEDSFGFQLKRLRQYLRRQKVGRLTIKKRGTAVDPAELRHRLDLNGEEEMTIVLTRLGEQPSVLVVKPLST